MNGRFRVANESMSENPVNSKTLSSGEDHGERRECTLDALTLNEVSDAVAPVTLHTHLLGDPCLAHVLPFDMSSVQSSSAAERAKFAMVGLANGCSRSANESMSEIPVTSNTPPFGEDFRDHRECTLDALTLNEVSGAAVPVTLHTHLPGDPCPAHSCVVGGTRDRAMSKYADVVLCRKQDWPRGRRVDSRTTHAAMISKSQAFCLFCEYFSALYTPKECTICDEMHLELLWCENCSRCACLECNRQEALDADYDNRKR